MGLTKFYDLIPELESWGDLNGHPCEPSTWLCGVGSFDHAIAYTTLFWPEFVEHDGCVFIDDAPDIEDYKSWLKSTDGEKHRVESVLNHIHLADLFSGGKPTVAQLEYLGEKIQRMWQAKANAEFPGRNVVVEFYRGSAEDLVEYQVTLFQAPTDVT